MTRYRTTENGDVPFTPEEEAERDALERTWVLEQSERIKSLILEAVQNRLDAFAKTRNYDNILSACTYATDINARFALEGSYCVAARGATWQTLYDILAQVESGVRPAPTCFADIESELPTLTWPE